MKKPKKITDLRQSRQIGGIKTQNKFRNIRLTNIEWAVVVLAGVCIINGLAILRMVLR